MRGATWQAHDAVRPAIFVRRGPSILVITLRHFAAPWTRPGEGPLPLTMSELALLLEGSEHALRVRLSPEPYRPMSDGAHA